MTKTTTIILVFAISLAGLALAFLDYWLDLTSPWNQVLLPIEQPATSTNQGHPTSASSSSAEQPLSADQDWAILLDQALLKYLGEDYKIVRQGECGEVIGVKHNGREMAISQAADLKWSVQSIEKAVILKKTDAGCSSIFSLTPSEVKDSQGEIIVQQKEAEFGYGFGLIAIDDGWIFETAMLDEQGLLASEAFSVYWHSAECGYAVLFAGEQID